MVRRLACLPFLKAEDVTLGFNVATSTINDLDEGDIRREKMGQLKDYFHSTWIGDSGRFPQDLWTRHNVTGNWKELWRESHMANYWSGPRTNNHLEGWHSFLNRSVGVAHPNVFRFIDAIKKQQKMFELKLIQISTNGIVTVQKSTYARMEKKLTSALDDYNAEEITVKGLLDNAGRLIKLGSPS